MFSRIEVTFKSTKAAKKFAAIMTARIGSVEVDGKVWVAEGALEVEAASNVLAENSC